jgi:hypothetical protein
MNGQAGDYLPGIGLDIGTAFICVARKLNNADVEFLSQRDAFLELEPVSALNAKMIQKSLDAKGAFYLNKEGKFFIVGQHAVEVATERGQNVDRPLKQGILSAKDRESFGMLSKIIEILVKPPVVAGEKCYYTYPADPVDASFDAIYHQKVVGGILGETLGYEAIPVLEAEALAYSELLDEGLTGIAMSWGAGQTNVCVMHMGSNVLSFSVARGGDWIDHKVSEQLGHSDTIIQAEKEAGLTLMDPVGDIQKALAIYYDHLMNYVATLIEKKISEVTTLPNFKKPIKVVLSGGTSLADGFSEKFKEILVTKQFQINIGSIDKAGDPLTAVANGCLIASQL